MLNLILNWKHEFEKIQTNYVQLINNNFQLIDVNNFLFSIFSGLRYFNYRPYEK